MFPRLQYCTKNAHATGTLPGPSCESLQSFPVLREPLCSKGKGGEKGRKRRHGKRKGRRENTYPPLRDKFLVTTVDQSKWDRSKNKLRTKQQDTAHIVTQPTRNVTYADR